MTLLRTRYRLSHPLYFIVNARTLSRLGQYEQAVFASGNDRNRLERLTVGVRPDVGGALARVADGFGSLRGARVMVDGRCTIEAGTGLAYRGATLLNPPVVSDLRHFERMVCRSLASLAVRWPVARRGGDGAVMLVRHVWEANHYHLINDVIAQFRLLATDPGLAVDEVLVAPVTWNNPLFSLFRQTSPLMRGVRVRSQTQNERVAKLTFARVPHADIANFDFLLDQLPARDVTGPGRDRRIFVGRRSGSGRCITNVRALEAGLRRRGFQTIYADEMTIAEQIDMFAAAGTVVGIHGAGLTNIIFRRGGRLSLVEIFPPTLIASHYASICAEYGFGYDAVVGLGAVPSSRTGRLRHDPTYANFTVDVSEVFRAVDALGERS